MKPGEIYYGHVRPREISTLTFLNRLRMECEIRAGLKPMMPPTIRTTKSKKIEKVLFVSPSSSSGFGHPCYTFLGPLQEFADTSHFDQMAILKDGKKHMNEMLLREVERSSPDLVFFFIFREEFDPRILRYISEETSSVTFNCFADDEWRFHYYTRFWAPLFNFCSTTDPSAPEMYKKLGYGNVMLNPWGIDPALFRKMDKKHLYDVSFVGAAYHHRKKLMKRLTAKGINIKCFGPGWDSGVLGLEQMVEVFNQSRINLNFSKSMYDPNIRMLKSRPFEVSASGGFVLTETTPALGDYYDLEKEVGVFEDEEELVEKLRYYLSHGEERQLMAEAAYKRTLKDHTSQKRLRKIFSWIESSL